MSPFTVETPAAAVPPFTLAGKATFMDPAGITPSNIVRVGDEAKIKIELETGGVFEPFLFGDAQWCAEAKFEGFGTDAEFIEGPVYEPITPGGPNNYTFYIPVPDTVAAGTYKVAVVVRIIRAVPPNDPAPVVAMTELPLIQYYDV